MFLRVTNHTGQVEKNLLGAAAIRTRDFRFTSPMLHQLSYRSSWELVVKVGTEGRGFESQPAK